MSDESRDRWLIDGDCSKCRRKEYCGTECAASKRRTYAHIMEMVRDRLGVKKIENMIKQSEMSL